MKYNMIQQILHTGYDNAPINILPLRGWVTVLSSGKRCSFCKIWHTVPHPWVMKVCGKYLGGVLEFTHNFFQGFTLRYMYLWSHPVTQLSYQILLVLSAGYPSSPRENTDRCISLTAINSILTIKYFLSWKCCLLVTSAAYIQVHFRPDLPWKQTIWTLIRMKQSDVDPYRLQYAT